MKEYVIDGIKYGMDSEFWKCFYVFDYKKHFLSCDSKRTIEDYINHLESDLKHFMEPENIEWIKSKDDSDKWIVKHSKESLLAQIEGLKKAIEELKMEDSK